mgnify:CR=1 FL=1
MSSEIYEIIPGLYQGSHLRSLPDHIEAVLNVDYTAARYKTDALREYAHKPILDGPDPGNEWLNEAIATLERFRANKWNTYIHCQAGVSRSVFVTAALLVKEQGLTPYEAVKLINSKSNHADPAPAFLLALERFSKREACLNTIAA